MRRCVFLILTVAVAVAAVGAYLAIRSYGPSGAYTVISEPCIVKDAEGRWTFVNKGEILSDPPQLARFLRQVRRVHVESPEGTSQAWTWSRCLPKDWNDDFKAE